MLHSWKVMLLTSYVIVKLVLGLDQLYGDDDILWLGDATSFAWGLSTYIMILQDYQVQLS